MRRARVERKMESSKILVTMLAIAVCGSALVNAAQEMPCCSLAAGSCRSVCSKIALVALGAESEARENATQRLHKFCSPELAQFWSCINSTLSEIRRNEHWPGRGCCYLAQNPTCGSKCALAGSREDLIASCRLSDEPQLFGCLERREEGERCCSNVSNDTCRSICRELFDKPGKQSSLRVYSSKGCFHQVPRCLKSAVEVKQAEDPRQHLHCCDEASSPACLETCRKVLHTATTDQEIMDALAEKCGPVLPQSPIWSCLLKSGSAKPTRLPLDVAKLTCCTKAVTRDCLNLCWRAFRADWQSAWTKFDNKCLSSNSEGELRRCLEDADNPCEMGCSGLSYCARFNDRSTTLFRTCSSKADDAAKFQADLWSRGDTIQGLGVPVRAAASCPVETLRAASCLLQLRPCESRVHETRLCREDCLELMASCVDWSVITGPHTAATLCSKLSPGRPDAPCVSLKPFLDDPQDNESTMHPEEDITTPCKDEACPPGHICALRPNGAKIYRCLPACSLGEMSKQLVPVGSWVQIPRFNEQSCLRICQCTAHGLEKCRSFNCFNFDSCWVHDRFIPHKTNFYLDCNPCHCFEGEYTCSKKSCGEARAAALPCDCPAHYVPVCGRLGFTLASSCLAKCAELSANEIEFGRCSSRDPCANNPCDTGEKCVRRTRVCLSRLHKPCKQYECVPMSCDPRDENSGPVCDRDNRQHKSVCSMMKGRAALGYRGPCLKGCSLRGPVCGINGEVYANECAAWAEKSVVDYFGSCVAVGLIGEEPEARCNEAVECPRLAQPYCIGVTPPGACCPVCGGAAKLFYSKKQIDKIYYVMDEESEKDSVTLDALLTALGRQIQVAECVLRGMMTPDRDIFIVVQPISKRPSALQLGACVAELEKLVTRILERSPRIASEIPLSSLTRAEIAHSYVSSASHVGGLASPIFLIAISVYSILI